MKSGIPAAADSNGFISTSRVRVMNIVCIISVSLALISSFVGADSRPFMISLLILAAIFGITLLLNNVPKRGLLPEYFITFATTAWIICMCIAFPNSLGEQNYLIIALVALAIFSRNKIYRTICIISLILLSVLLVLYQQYYPPFFTLPRAANFLFVINVATPLTIIALICRKVLKDALRSQETIEQQRLQLEESNKFKDKILSIVGHDMRAPFNTTRSLIEVLESDVLTAEERRNTLWELRNNIDVSLETLDNILGWASQEYFGNVLKTKTKVERLDVVAIVEKITIFFRHIALQKNIAFVNKISPDTVVAGDFEQISFVFRNITSNALKFSYPGQSISFAANANGSHVTISIHDEGVGMPEDAIASLFQINTRFSKEGTTNEKGTGLGLIFCKEFIENNKGELWIESQPGNGTTIFFSLPKVAEEN